MCGQEEASVTDCPKAARVYLRARWVPCRSRSEVPPAGPPEAGSGPGGRDDGGVKTRTLLILAALTAAAIVAAGAVQIFLAR